MQHTMVEQVSLFDLDTPSTKTFPEHSAPTRAKTSERSCNRSSASLSKKRPTFLCLRADGANSGRSAEWETMEHPFPWLGELTMHSTAVSHKDGKESVYWLTSADIRRQRYCLTLNTGKRPRKVIRVLLRDILETNPDPKYNLSAKACQGVLNRAQNRQKKLPEQLYAALKAQIERERERESSRG